MILHTLTLSHFFCFRFALKEQTVFSLIHLHMLYGDCVVGIKLNGAGRELLSSK